MRFLYLLISLVLSLHLSAQLPRKASFGARIDYIGSIASPGCRVIEVMRGTSIALKLKKDDVILKIGNASFKSTDAFIAEFLN
jgi:hypothetical protein